MVKELTGEDFGQATSSGLVVVDLWAPWCGPCKMIAPVIEELAAEYEGKIAFCKLNIDEHKGPAIEHQVMSIPTLLIFKDGAVADRIVGALPKEKIEEKLKSVL
jgi:thioredoxin 1